MPVNSLIVGVDLAPIKPIPKVITFQSDITTEQCRATIRKHLKTWKADTVLHDGAPNVGTAWVQDSFNQAELALQSMKLATEFLVEGGTFVTKVFRSKDYNSLLWVFNQLFTKVEATKPPSSRNVSAEIFVVCRGFKAPKRIDPKFLDPRAVFEELAAPTPNNEAKVYNPEIKKRKRDGYEEGDWTQFKEIPATEFIQTTDPIAILGGVNRLHFDQAKNGDVALAALNKLPETTDEIRRNCEDLKVLGRKEFKMLLKWRLKVREIFGFPTKKTAQDETVEETAEVESMDEEMKAQEQLQALKDRESSKKKKERRRENEKKQKDIVRMQLNMTAPMDIGMEEQGPMGEDAMFQLKAVDQDGALNRIAKGKMVKVSDKQPNKALASHIALDDSDDESDEAEDRLERELDNMYDSYKERKAATDAKYRAKRSRKEHDDDEWEGVSADEQAASDQESELEEDSDDESTDQDGPQQKSLLTDLDNDKGDGSGLSKRARAFFNQDIFKDVEGLLDELKEEDAFEPAVAEAEEMEVAEIDEVSSDEDIPDVSKKAKSKTIRTPPEDDSDGEDSEPVKHGQKEADDDDESDWEEEVKREKREGRPGMISPPSCHRYAAQLLTHVHRHRYYHGGSHDASPRARHGQEIQPRLDGRRLQQARLPGPGRPARVVRRGRVAARQTAEAHHQGGRASYQGEAAGAERPAHQEGARGQGPQEAPRGGPPGEAQEEERHPGGVRGHDGAGEGRQHRQADGQGQQEDQAAAHQGRGRAGRQQGQGPAGRCQGPVQDGGPEDEEGDAGAQEEGQVEALRVDFSSVGWCWLSGKKNKRGTI